MRSFGASFRASVAAKARDNRSGTSSDLAALGHLPHRGRLSFSPAFSASFPYRSVNRHTHTVEIAINIRLPPVPFPARGIPFVEGIGILQYVIQGTPRKVRDLSEFNVQGSILQEPSPLGKVAFAEPAEQMTDEVLSRFVSRLCRGKGAGQ